MTELHRPRVAGYAFTAAAGLLLVGCSSADETGTDTELGPISQRVIALEEQFDADVLSAHTDALEEQVADCMKAQGFDYTPQRQDTAALEASLDLPDMNTVEFAEQYGYGLTTLDDASATGDQATEPPTAQASTLEYQEALLGSDYPAGKAQMPGGCFGEAMATVFGDDVASMDTTVAADIAGLTSSAEQDDRVVAALDEWSTCMDDRGYDYATPDAAMRSIASRAYDSTGTLVQDDALSTLRTEEIDTAVADLGCRDSSGLTQAKAEVLARLETDYYAAHRDEVDAYLDQLEAVIKAT